MDLKFDTSGDIIIDELKRIQEVDGVDKVKQDVIHILKCVKGSDSFHPEFGVDWIKIKQSGYSKVLISHEIMKALSKYDKIKSVDRIEISEPDGNRNVRIKLFLTLDSEKIDVDVIV